MSLRTLLLLVVSLTLLLPDAWGGEGKGSPHPNGMNPPVPDEVMGRCNTIAAIVAVYPAFEVQTKKGRIRDLQGIRELSGCRVTATGPASGIAGEIDPAEAIRIQFQGDRWVEDIRYAADGPGTTSFVFRRNGVWCRTNGGAHSWIEDGKIFASERYELEMECVSDPDGTAPGQ